MSQHLKRRISPFMLFALSVNALIGSGWLFAPFYVAKIAGPAAIFAWIIGGGAVMLVALTFAELTAMLPIAGGSAHVPQLSHGPLVSYLLSLIAWVSAVILSPIEVQAILQYASLTFPSLMTMTNGVPVLSHIGYLWAVIFMLGLSSVNIFNYAGLMRSSFFIFLMKVTIIILAIFALIHVRFEPGNFAGMQARLTTADGWQAVLSAVATGGVILGFNGFKSGVEMAGEATNLRFAIPLATAGAVFACLLMYLGLQVAFIGAIDGQAIAHGWSNLSFTGQNGPLVGLTTGLGMYVVAKLLYLNSVVSPMGAGLIYTTSTSRITYAMSKMGYLPAFLSRLNRQHLPTYAIIFNFCCGMLSFLPLPGWQTMVNFLVSAMVITYAIGPIALMSLRYNLPNRARPYRLPAAGLLCPLAFYFCNLFSYWTGWYAISRLAIVLLAGFVIFFIAYWRGRVTLTKAERKSGVWMFVYLVGLVILSWLSAFGGLNIIPFGWDFVVVGVYSYIVYTMAVHTRIPVAVDSLLARLDANKLNHEDHLVLGQGL